MSTRWILYTNRAVVIRLCIRSSSNSVTYQIIWLNDTFYTGTYYFIFQRCSRQFFYWNFNINSSQKIINIHFHHHYLNQIKSNQSKCVLSLLLLLLLLLLPLVCIDIQCNVRIKTNFFIANAAALSKREISAAVTLCINDIIAVENQLALVKADVSH